MRRSTRIGHTRATEQKAVQRTYFRLLDLPLELQEMIYDHAYGDIDLVLTFDPHSEASGVWYPSWPYMETSPKWSTISGFPGTYIHMVSRNLARNAGKIWRNKTSRLTIDYEGYGAGLDFTRQFCFNQLYRDLRERLVEFEIRDSHDQNIPWTKLVKLCPKIQIVKIYYTEWAEDLEELEDEGPKTRKEFTARLLRKVLSTEPEDLKEIERYDLPDLIWILVQANRNYKVTYTLRVEGEWLFLSDLNEDEDNADDITHNYENEWKLECNTKGFTVVSKQCRASVVEPDGSDFTLHKKWRTGVQEPLVTDGGPGNWKQELVPSGNPEHDRWELTLTETVSDFTKWTG